MHPATPLERGCGSVNSETSPRQQHRRSRRRLISNGCGKVGVIGRRPERRSSSAKLLGDQATMRFCSQPCQHIGPLPRPCAASRSHGPSRGAPEWSRSSEVIHTVKEGLSGGQLSVACMLLKACDGLMFHMFKTAEVHGYAWSPPAPFLEEDPLGETRTRTLKRCSKRPLEPRRTTTRCAIVQHEAFRC